MHLFEFSQSRHNELRGVEQFVHYLLYLSGYLPYAQSLQTNGSLQLSQSGNVSLQLIQKGPLKY